MRVLQDFSAGVYMWKHYLVKLQHEQLFLPLINMYLLPMPCVQAPQRGRRHLIREQTQQTTYNERLCPRSIQTSGVGITTSRSATITFRSRSNTEERSWSHM